MSQSEQLVCVYGKNFFGEIQLKADSVTLDITDLTNRKLYVASITNEMLDQDPKRFFVFNKIEELFDELAISQHMEITSETLLLLPIQITFRNKKIERKIQLWLEERKFNSESESCSAIYERLSKIHKESFNWRRHLTPQAIKFQVNKANSNDKHYNINEESRQVTFVGQFQHSLLYHDTPLPKKGIFHFKLKIIKSNNSRISFGVAGIDASLNENFNNSSSFIGGLIEGAGSIIPFGPFKASPSNSMDKQVVLSILGKSQDKKVTSGFKIVQGKSVFKVEVDMNRKLVAFHMDGTPLYTAPFWKQMGNIEVYLVISLQSNGDSIEFIDE